jgi:predicted peroxiredoxin
MPRLTITIFPTTHIRILAMKFIISGSYGTDNPTMATLPFMASKTAQEQGHEVVLSFGMRQ